MKLEETEAETNNCLPNIKAQAEAAKCGCRSCIKPMENVAKLTGAGGYTKQQIISVQMRQSVSL